MTATVPQWWSPPWSSSEDPDSSCPADTTTGVEGDDCWNTTDGSADDEIEAILAPLEAELAQVRSRDRVRDLAEVFTHQREIDAILDTVADAFGALDIKFLEPACGSGNFTVEILRRKLRLVTKTDCATQDQYEHRLLRAVASIYGVDISPENVTEARARMAHVLLNHYQTDANTVEPTPGFVAAAALILDANIVCGDTLNRSHEIELCDWRPTAGGHFQRVWSHALIPPADRDLFWVERIEDSMPVHFSELRSDAPDANTASKPRRARSRR